MIALDYQKAIFYYMSEVYSQMLYYIYIYIYIYIYTQRTD
jgi:hypothetical protein